MNSHSDCEPASMDSSSSSSHRLLLKSLAILLFFALASLHSSIRHSLPRPPRRQLAEIHGEPFNCHSSSRTSRSIVNYTSLHFCQLHGRAWLSVPLFVTAVILAFYILADAAEHHFSLIVRRMAEMLHLSPSMGGVTLLALGNGAPDVFASIAAVRGGNARIGLGAIVSAGIFVTAFVVGFVALAAAPFTVKPFPFVRDVCFYMVAAMLMFFVYLSGEVYLWQALGLVTFYILFVVVVLCMDQVRGKTKALKVSTSELDQDKLRSFEPTTDLHAGDDFDTAIAGESTRQSNGVNRMPAIASSNGVLSEDNGSVGGGKKDMEAGNLSSVRQRDANQSRNMAQVLVEIVSPLFYCVHSNCRICKGASKFGLLWQLPVEVMLKSTIPAVDPSKWDRFHASANFVLCPLILLYIFSSVVSPNHHIVFLLPGTVFPLWFVVLLQGSFLGVAYFFSAKEPPQKEQPFAVVTAFVMSVFWISFIAGELLGCLAALGIVLELPPALLGLTVLAWGNSIGDLVGDVAVARAGQPAMAMAGCFAGPMFNMLFGFGLALAIRSAHLHPSSYQLEYNPSIITAFGFLFASLLGSLLVVTWSRFQVPRLWGFCLIGLYITFVVVSLSTANLL